MERKLVKKFTGHTSDAVDQYQITSDKQREKISSIISGEGEVVKPIEVHLQSKTRETKSPRKAKVSEPPSNSLEISVNNVSVKSTLGCSCTRQNINLEET